MTDELFKRHNPLTRRTDRPIGDVRRMTGLEFPSEDYPGDVRHPLPERRTPLATIRAKAAYVRTALTYFAFGVLTAASVAILLHLLGA